MKQVLHTLALLSLGSAACAQDWSGARVGLQTTNADFDATYFLLGVDVDNGPGSGQMKGLYAGYDHQIGNLVLGGEIAYSSGDAFLDNAVGVFFSDMLDLKARMGYAFGRVLPYAVVGYSKTEWSDNPNVPEDADGFAYGIGAEVMVSDRLTVGLEYLNRNLVADPFVGSPTQHIEAEFSTISLRVGLKF